MANRTGAIPKRRARLASYPTPGADTVEPAPQVETKAEPAPKEDVVINIEVLQGEKVPPKSCWSRFVAYIFALFGVMFFRKKVVVERKERGTKTPFRFIKNKKRLQSDMKRRVLYSQYSTGERRNAVISQLAAHSVNQIPELQIPPMKPKEILMPKFDPARGEIIVNKLGQKINLPTQSESNVPGSSKTVNAGISSFKIVTHVDNLERFHQWAGRQSGLDLFRTVPSRPFYEDYISLATFFARR